MSDRDDLFWMTTLLGSMINGPSNAGEREDGKICTAQGGECRFNPLYYSPGMHDARSWSVPCASDSCPQNRPYLRADSEPSDMGTHEERTARAGKLLGGMQKRGEEKETIGMFSLEMMGINPFDGKK